MGTRKTAGWTRLDNAAKIFPSTSSMEDTKVFRFVCELYEPVEPVFLQQALEQTMEQFPLYWCVLHRGMFWYYLEESALEPKVREEYRPPCGPLYDRNRKNLLFEVTFYRCRINLEVYHVLSDGTGALQFLRALVYHYLLLRHPEASKDIPALDYDASLTEKSDDSFRKYYAGAPKGRKGKAQRAYRLTGRRDEEYRTHIVEGIVSVRSVIGKAHEYGVSVTVLLCAALMAAIAEQMPMRQRRLPVVITVPVNLRKYFFSESARNFFCVINVSAYFHDPAQPPEEVLKRVIGEVQESFQKELTKQSLAARMNELAALEHNAFMRAVPLAVKDVVLRAANRFSEKGVTAALSNIGQVKMPQGLDAYIRLFDVACSTNRVQLCMCSFGDSLVLNFSSPFHDAEIQKVFFRILTRMGIQVEVATNRFDEEEAHEGVLK